VIIPQKSTIDTSGNWNDSNTAGIECLNKIASVSVISSVLHKFDAAQSLYLLDSLVVK